MTSADRTWPGLKPLRWEDVIWQPARAGSGWQSGETGEGVSGLPGKLLPLLQAFLPAPFAATSACPYPLPLHPTHLDLAEAGRVKSGLEEPQAWSSESSDAPEAPCSVGCGPGCHDDFPPRRSLSIPVCLLTFPPVSSPIQPSYSLSHDHPLSLRHLVSPLAPTHPLQALCVFTLLH